jgi:RNA-directed DNA polymerase
MNTAEKYQTQMNLYGEWVNGNPPVSGADVYCKRTGKVSREWISDSEKERALTQDLMAEVCELSNLAAACRQVVKNGGSPGIDRMTTKELKDGFMEQQRELREQLLKCNYKPETVLGKEIPKPDGGVRVLGIPTVKDRLVQQAISQVLSKRYERIFSANSYGFRPGRSAHQGLNKAGQYVREGYNYVVDIDLEKFFDKVNHDRLMSILSRRIADKILLRLIQKFLKTGILTEGLESQRVAGTPQGSPLSPLLSNIVLDELDKELERRGHRFVRYADDMIILVRSEEAANRVKESITGFIEDRLLLKVNQTKSRICRPYELNFLGHTILPDGSLGLSRKSEQRFKEKLRQLTRRNRGISLEQLVKELNPKLRGWLEYFKYASMKKRLANFESWLRRKIRCFRLKQCKRASGIIKFLTGLGVPKWRGILLAVSRRGWFRKSLSPQAHEGMNKAWFTKIGLFSLTANYS